MNDLNDMPNDYLSFIKLHFMKLLKHFCYLKLWVFLLQDFTVSGEFFLLIPA